MNDIIEERHRQYIDKINELRIIDDDFMKVVFKDDDCIGHVIQTVLQEDYQNIIDSQIEYDMKNPYGRSYRIYILAVDIEGRHINVEFQKYRQKASFKRARRHISMIDVNMSRKKEKYHELKDIKTIFFTEKYELGNGLPISHINRYVDETIKKVNDGTEIIYIPVNTRDGSSLDLLKEDLLEKQARNIHSEVLRKRVEYLKASEEGQRTMCKIFEEVREDGRKEGIEENKEMVVRIMLSEGEPIEKIMKYTDSSIEKINNIKNNML